MSDPNFWCHKCQAPIHVEDPEANFACPQCQESFIENYTPPAEDPPQFQQAQRAIRFRQNFRVPMGMGVPDDADAAADDDMPQHPLMALDGLLRNLLSASTEQRSPASRERLEAIHAFFTQLVRSEPFGMGAHQDVAPDENLLERMEAIHIDAGHEALGNDCSVCQMQFELNDECRRLPCEHLFHQDCLAPWLAQKSTCPVCRTDCRASAASGMHPNPWE